MPTLDGDKPGAEPELGLLATHYGGKAPLGERFRRAQLRAQMFGDPGETLTVGRYEITGRIGAGAMGSVYRAVDPALDREVAVKLLHRSDEMHRARMTIEAKALAKLSHPNVVTVHEVGTEDDQLFVAMELVQGRTLGAWLQAPEGPRVLEVFVQAAEGLQAAHDAGIVHRDFKPDNVIVGDDARVRVLDFGMARTPGAPLLQEVDGEPDEQRALEPAITRTGLLAGTPGYMAPEQFEGARVDARADQFAFCIVLHEAIWGTRPFAGETVAELARAVLSGEAELFEGQPRPDLAPHEIDAAKAVIERGLKTEPQARFASMREVASHLRPAPALVEAPPVVPRPRLFAGMLTALIVAVAGVGYLVAPTDDEPGVEATAMVNQTGEGIEAVLSNRCGATVRYAIAGEDGPADELSVQSLETGRSLPITVSDERRVWIIKSDGTRGAAGWTEDPAHEITIGPSCTTINVGPIGSYRAMSIEQLRKGGTDLPNVPGELPGLSEIPGVEVGPEALRFESLQLARIVDGEIEPGARSAHLVLPLYGHLAAWSAQNTPDPDRRIAIHADASTPFSTLIDVLYTSGKAGFRAYELVAETGSGKRGALRLSPPVFPAAPGHGAALEVRVLPEGFSVGGLESASLIPPVSGKHGLASYDFTALARAAAEHRDTFSSIRAVVSASDDIRNDVLVRTLATLRGKACTTDPAKCLLTHLTIEAGDGGDREASPSP